MKKSKKVLSAIFMAAVMFCMQGIPVFAITETEVQTQVSAAGKEAVAGNLLIWFLCAVAFLKVSQKIDSFMSSLGIHVGNTGGSLLAEAMIAARGLGAVRSFPARFGGRNGSTAASGADGTGFLSGGLAGVASRTMTNSAVQAVTGGQSSNSFAAHMYTSSVGRDGNFANGVVGRIATGSAASVGTIAGEKAAEALHSYMGYAALGEGAEHVPSFTGVEIGGGRITGTEISEENPEGIAFGMYHTDQYAVPDGEHTTVQAVDGTSWYKQYAVDGVEKSPYMAADGSIAYKEAIVKKIPSPPKRKERI